MSAGRRERMLGLRNLSRHLFFFQAEDGIRDLTVTGVQTCALPISPLPVPAEVVVPPAAFLAAQGRLSLAGVVLASTLGAYLGAALMYWLSLWLGRPLVVRFGR